MNSKVIGAMLILGPILTMGTWMVYNVETSGMSVPNILGALLAEEGKVQIGTAIRILGLTSMFMGLYFLSRTLKSDNTVSNVASEIGGLLLLLCIPIWILLEGSHVAAINAVDNLDKNAGETIIAASRMLRTVFFPFAGGIFLLGLAMTVLRRYKGIIGVLFMLTSAAGFVGIDIVAWLGMFGVTAVTGILTFLQKEEQNQ